MTQIVKMDEPDYRTLQGPRWRCGLRLIVSGGQDGVDRGALDGAKDQVFPTGGWAPKGWRTTRGSDPSLESYGLKEHNSAAYQPRTKQNVADSDGTLILASNMDSPGTALTLSTAAKLRKPTFTVKLPRQKDCENGVYVPTGTDDLINFLFVNQINVLNVAGNHLQPDYHWQAAYSTVAALLINLRQRKLL